MEKKDIDKKREKAKGEKVKRKKNNFHYRTNKDE